MWSLDGHWICIWCIYKYFKLNKLNCDSQYNSWYFRLLPDTKIESYWAKKKNPPTLLCYTNVIYIIYNIIEIYILFTYLSIYLSRERERDTQTQTDRQTDRQTGREGGREGGRDGRGHSGPSTDVKRCWGARWEESGGDWPLADTHPGPEGEEVVLLVVNDVPGVPLVPLLWVAKPHGARAELSHATAPRPRAAPAPQTHTSE